MARKFLELEDRWEPGGFFSLADCTSDAVSSNRNREKPNLSSLPPTIKHALHCVSPFFFVPLLRLSQASPTETLATVVTPSGTLTMSRWFTCLSYQKRRSQTSTLLLPVRYDGYYRTAFLPFIPSVRMLSMIMRKLSCIRRIITPSDSHIRG